MEISRLNENWKMRRACGGEWLKAAVPGTVYADLLRNRAMPDPYWKDNGDDACTLMEEDYEYECTFPGQEVRGFFAVFLRFSGIDTIADIWLNGTFLGHTGNMHRVWEFDVRALLFSNEENTLRIVLRSPLKYIAEAYEKYKIRGNGDTYEGFMHLRKAHYMFGWDWGAHLPDAGIFRDVELCREKCGRIDSVYIRQTHEDGRCILDFDAETIMEGAGTYRVQIVVTAPQAAAEETAGSRAESGRYETVLSADGRGRIVIDHPRLWWVNGLGEQPLYEVEAVLFCDGEAADVWRRRIGLRSLTVKREKDAWGEGFAQVINGKAFFAMGADYIPEEHILGRRSREKTRRLLEDCRMANFNVIRVWGGGFYPDDWFYDICDELGLAVWQDFMFACSDYELTPEFEAEVRQELIDNIKRIRHHASLALWCGNNENEGFVEQRLWVTKQTEVRDYLFLFERVIPDVLKEYDPQTFYWPSSPSSGGAFDNPNDPDRGDMHYWDVWHGNKPFAEYRKFFFRYLSEFGFQSFPCKKTVETFTDDPADWNIFSYVMEKHQRNGEANGKIMNYLQQTYRYPGAFETVLYASQLLQAEAVRYGAEHFRRNRGRCMGVLYWQLNDCWPVISWSSIDYCGRWKALHYYARRFFAPVLISCEEEGWLTCGKNMNLQHFRPQKSIRLNVANETMEEKHILVKWFLRNADAAVLKEEQREVTVPALCSVWLDKVELPDVDVFSEYVSYEAWEGEQVLSQGTVIFSYPKYFKYENPRISWSVEGRYLTIKSDAYAKSVEIQNGAEDLVLSDNYFDLNGDSRVVEVLRGEIDNIRIRSVYDIG